MVDYIDGMETCMTSWGFSKRGAAMTGTNAKKSRRTHEGLRPARKSMGDISEETDADQLNDTNAKDRDARIEGRTTCRVVAEITTRV